MGVYKTSPVIGSIVTPPFEVVSINETVVLSITPSGSLSFILVEIKTDIPSSVDTLSLTALGGKLRGDCTMMMVVSHISTFPIESHNKTQTVSKAPFTGLFEFNVKQLSRSIVKLLMSTSLSISQISVRSTSDNS